MKWNGDLDAQLLALKVQGLSWREVGEVMGCTGPQAANRYHGSIMGRVYTHKSSYKAKDTSKVRSPYRHDEHNYTEKWIDFHARKVVERSAAHA